MARAYAMLPMKLASIRDIAPKMERKRVVIIGGGFAGLSAGWWLVSHGFSVTVLEARERVGGRVHTLTESGQPIIEQGGELIGRNHPHWLGFARNFGLGLSLITDEDNYTYEGLRSPFIVGGRNLEKREQNDLFEEMTQALASLNKEAASIVDADMPWMAKHAAKWDQCSVADWLSSLKGYNELVKNAIRFELESNQGVSAEKQSYLGLLAMVKGGALSHLSRLRKRPSEFWTESEVYRCASGNQELAKALRKAIIDAGSENKVFLSTPVRIIEVDEHSANAITEKGDNYPANWVIIAIPPSCYADVQIPSELRPGQLQMGSAVKYLSFFKHRFWLHEGVAPSGTDDSLGMTWEGSDNQNLPPRTLPELSVFAGGQAACNAANATNTSDYFADALERIYPGYKRELVNSSFENWPSEVWTKAGYSCPAPGQVTSVARYFFEPHARIVYAGEHTSMAFFGYMEGALHSGLHAAQLIARAEGISELESIWDKRLQNAI